VFIQATEPDTQLYHYQVLQGRWFSGDEPNAVLINETTARTTGLKVGDTLTLSNADRSVSWTIIGVARDLNSDFNTIGNAVTTISNLHAFDGIPANVGTSFYIGAADHSTAAVDRMASALDDTLGSKGLTPSISTAQQEKARNQTQFGILDALLYAVAAIVALVGILGLFNTLTTSVLERRREIGILRSMGATSQRVAGAFWTEGMALAGISWVLAIALGIPAAYGFVALISAQLLPVPFAFNPVSLAVMLVFTFVIASLASALPALRAAHVRIADTLRYE
jgi:putative ABC transport system permease protein